MRILIKGGVWKNTEDEILKAAVMKYGKNQWARISSLLTRKTPKQCKARWFEWLDPSIKKTEWSKEEDEKLLHLAKLMPTQWRTIAPIVGRTAAQCLERYQKLLDDAEIGDDVDKGLNSDDVRKLRPGEIDPDPETKPARPDPVDMEEDEKEMLSEARARLANTQGKKAKRKAREKQLEEARRLAALQKRRELKAAGITSRIWHNQKGMDYNADIPFHHQQPAGFWDVREESEREKKEKTVLTNKLLSSFEGKRRYEIEEQERKKDFKRQKMKKETEDYVPQQAIREAETLKITPRGNMTLPAPQVSEAELEEIVKIGASGETIRTAIESQGGSTLLGTDYSSFRAPTPLRTPRAVGTQHSIQQQARNLRAMSEAQTPLLGGEVSLEGQVTFSGATPRPTAIATPNPLAAHLTPRINAADGSRTPMTGSIFGRTPLRDQMGINTPRSDFGSVTSATPTEVKRQQELARQQLSVHFSAVPKPKNDFEIVAPETDEDAMIVTQAIEDDIEDVEMSEAARRKQQLEAKLRRRSQAVQRDLPRPTVSLNLIVELYSDGQKEETAESLISREKALLLHHDAVNHRTASQTPLCATDKLPKFEQLPDELLLQATQLIHNEFNSLRASMDEKPTSEFEAMHEEIIEGLMYSKASKEFVFVQQLNKANQLKAYKEQLEQYREVMRLHASKAQKQEKKLLVTQGGYMARAKSLTKELNGLFLEYQEAQIKLESYKLIQSKEEEWFESRVNTARKELHKLSLIEQDLQEEYRNKMVQ